LILLSFISLDRFGGNKKKHVRVECHQKRRWGSHYIFGYAIVGYSSV